MENIEKTPKTGDILTLAGTFSENIIYTIEGEKFKCCTFGSVREKIEGESGIFNLRYNANFADWVIFQYVFLDTILMDKLV